MKGYITEGTAKNGLASVENCFLKWPQNYGINIAPELANTILTSLST